MEALRAIDIGIFAKGAIPQKTEKQGHGFEGIMVSFGSTVMRSGNWLYVDENGWIVADRELEF